jgi:predicted dehydrogenase
MSADPAFRKGINTAILGCGAAFEFLYRYPLQRLAGSGWIKVAALVDSRRERLGKAESIFPGARGYGSEWECFAQERDVCLTIVLSPPTAHLQHCCIAVEHGSHVFCEKPLADTVEAGMAIMAAARDRRRVFALGMTRRFYPAVKQLRDLIRRGALGDTLVFSYRHGGVYNWSVVSAAPFYRGSSGGGVLLDKGVHAIDQCLYLFGDGSVVSCADDGSVQGVEANSMVELALGNASGSVHLSWDMPLSDAFAVSGTKADVWVPIAEVDTVFLREPGLTQPWRKVALDCDWPLDLEARSGERGRPQSHADCIYFELVQMLRCLLLDEEPSCCAADGIAALRMVRDAYARAVPLVKPWLPLAEQAVEQRSHRSAQR